jgi:hypothetical protein
MKLEKLQTEILHAYEAYTVDPFIVSQHLISLFDKPLQYLLESDIDYLATPL